MNTTRVHRNYLSLIQAIYLIPIRSNMTSMLLHRRPLYKKQLTPNNRRPLVAHYEEAPAEELKNGENVVISYFIKLCSYSLFTTLLCYIYYILHNLLCFSCLKWCTIQTRSIVCFAQFKLGHDINYNLKMQRRPASKLQNAKLQIGRFASALLCLQTLRSLQSCNMAKSTEIFLMLQNSANDESIKDILIPIIESLKVKDTEIISQTRSPILPEK